MRGSLAVAAVPLLALAFAGPAAAFSREDVRVTMDDGVGIAATLYRPDGEAPVQGWPAIVMFHGLGADRGTPYQQNSIAEIAETYLAPQGYAVLTFDARGHGQSGGLCSLDGPREVQDARRLFGWLTSQPGIDAAHVGAFGISLGAGYALDAAVRGVPFAAVVPMIGWADLYAALMPNGLPKTGLVGSFLSLLPQERWSPDVMAIAADAFAGRNGSALSAFAAERSSLAGLGSLHTPVFVIQGRRDFAFDLGQARRMFKALAGAKRLYLGDLGHAPSPNPAAERPRYLGEAREWFDRWLKGEPNGIDTGPRVEVAPDPWTGKTQLYRGWPPTRTLALSVRGRRTLRARGKAVWTIRLPSRRVEAFGAPTLSVTASTPTSWPRLVAVLTAVTPGGKELLVSEGGTPTPTGRKRFTLRFGLIDDAEPIPAGSRLRLTLGASSTVQSPANLLYLDTGTPTDAKVTVRAVKLRLPVLRKPISR